MATRRASISVRRTPLPANPRSGSPRNKVPLWIATIVAVNRAIAFFDFVPVKGSSSGESGDGWAATSMQVRAGARAARGGSLEDTCSGGGDRRRGGRRLHALSPCQEGLVRRGPVRADRTHRRIDLACRRPVAAVQHELRRGSAAQILGRPLQGPARGNRPGGELPRHRQFAARHQRRAHGRVPQVLRDRQHHRRAFRDRDPGGNRRALAAVQHRGAGRRALPSP